MARRNCGRPQCNRDHVHIRCENGECILVRGPHPYLKMRDKLLDSGMYVDNKRALRQLANAILRELDLPNGRKEGPDT